MRRTRQLLFQTETLKLELLNTPINQLDLKIEGTIFAQAIPLVKEELRRAGIRRLSQSSTFPLVMGASPASRSSRWGSTTFTPC